MQKLSKRDHVYSAGVVIVRKENDEYLYLVLRSNKGFDFAKGKVDKNESMYDAALREVEEEVSIEPGDLDFKWGFDTFSTKPYTKHNKIATYFVAETNKKDIVLPVNPDTGIKEHDSFYWLNYKDAKKLVGKNAIAAALDWAHGKIK